MSEANAENSWVCFTLNRKVENILYNKRVAIFMREQIVRFTEKQDTVNMRTYTRVLGPTFGKERPLKRDSEYRPFFRSVFEVNSYLLTSSAILQLTQCYTNQTKYFGRSRISCIFAQSNKAGMRKKKDIFDKVEADAKELLNNPESAGAAQTVLEFIEQQRRK